MFGINLWCGGIKFGGVESTGECLLVDHEKIFGWWGKSPHSPIMKNPADLMNSAITFSNDLTQMVSFSTWILACDSHSPPLLNSFISSNSAIYCKTTFPPLGSSDYVVI